MVEGPYLENGENFSSTGEEWRIGVVTPLQRMENGFSENGE